MSDNEDRLLEVIGTLDSVVVGVITGNSRKSVKDMDARELGRMMSDMAVKEFGFRGLTDEEIDLTVRFSEKCEEARKAMSECFDEWLCALMFGKLTIESKRLIVRALEDPDNAPPANQEVAG